MDGLSACPGSKRFQEVLGARDCKMLFRDWGDATYAIRCGSLKLKDKFIAPAIHTLLIGDLTVDGYIDLHCREVEMDGGSFVVIGDVKCDAFVSDYETATIIDGDLIAKDIVVNAFADSGLWVTRNLNTKFFYGGDIWAEVGGHAEMEYGDGYCLPIGYTEPEIEAIRPDHDIKASLRQLSVRDKKSLDAAMLLSLLEDKKPIFK